MDSGYFKNNIKGKERMSEYIPKETLQEVMTFPFVECKERAIRKETCERFGIRAAVSTKDGTTVEAFYFPSYNQKGKLVGYKKQDLTKGKEERGHWSAIGSVSINNKMFGQDVAESIQRKRNNVVNTEGEWDAVSVYQACVDNVKGTKFEGLEPFVVSIPLGTANAVESILHNKDFVESFDAYTFFFDDDFATPAEHKKGVMKGHEAREAVAGALVGNGQSLFVITPDHEFKDASDYLQRGKSNELAKLVQFGKRPFSAEKILKASDISLEELIAPQKKGIMLKSFPKFSESINGIREGELTLLLAPSNVGKTVISSIIAAEVMQGGMNVGMMYLEEDKRETFLRIVASYLKVNYLKLKEDPLSLVTREQLEEAYNFIAGQNRLTILDHFGSLPINDLMSKVKHMHLVEGSRLIILDHISMVVSGLETDNERRDLDNAMTALAAFCAANPVHVIVVSHINRTNAQQFLPPKGKEGEPFFVNVTKESARGSSALEGCSWNILGLEPEILPDFSRGRVRLKTLKTRFGNYLGITDVFTLDKETWQPVLESEQQYSF